MAVMIKKVGVIGSGQMGNGIAHVAALAGFDVVLNDVSTDRLKSAMATINGNLSRQGSREMGPGGGAQAGAGADGFRRYHGWIVRLRSGDRDGGGKRRGQAQDLS